MGNALDVSLDLLLEKLFIYNPGDESIAEGIAAIEEFAKQDQVHSPLVPQPLEKVMATGV
jgi:hypothetical protein